MRTRLGRAKRRWALRSLVAGALIVGAVAAIPLPGQSGAEPEGTTGQEPPASTPDLIEQAYRRGDIDSDTRWLYVVYALLRPDRLPVDFVGTAPWGGTLPLLDVKNALAASPDEPQAVHSAAIRAEIADLLTPRPSAELRGPLPPDAAIRGCGTFADPATHIYETDHFYIEYFESDLVLGNLTIEDYADSLEATWAKEVTSFGWAAPPVKTSDPPPGNRYHVRLEPFSPGVYGFVTSDGRHGGAVGDNPATAWTEPDALATCMVLNTDFETGFPGTAQQALNATTAHEFNHSIHAGYGILTGTNRPDQNFVEGGAVWMEDEAQDGANDYYNFLWPKFDDSMGEYDVGDAYAYGVTFRGLTERYGTTVAGGSEDVMQNMWERISQADVNANGRIMLDALNLALVDEGTTLADAYHAYAIAVQFLRPCGGGYAYPYCLEEGPAWKAIAGEPGVNGTIASTSGGGTGSIEDNYALNWINLPTSGTYNVTLSNTSAGGSLRGSVVCDTGAGFVISPLPAIVGAGATTTLAGFTPSGCQRVVAVITNQAQTAANPPSSTARSYTLSLSTGSPSSTTSSSTTSTTSTTTSTTTTTTPPAPGGFVLDGIGGIGGYGSSANIPGGRFGSDVARDIALIDKDTGYVLDAFGGIHAFGGAPNVDNGGRFGAPVARALVLRNNGASGYVLDGFGGIHAFGGAPNLDAGGRFSADVARDIAVVSPTGGYVLDNIGGIHAFGTASRVDTGGRFGAPVARAITFLSATSGYVLDGFGGVHNFGGAPSVDRGARFGSDIARDIVLQSLSPVGGYVLDGLGGVYVFGVTANVDKGLRFGSDIARGLVSAQTFMN